MIERRCPRCGAGLEGKNPYLPSYGRYECGSYANPRTETAACLRNQLDQAQELIAELERQNERILLDVLEESLERGVGGDEETLPEVRG